MLLTPAFRSLSRPSSPDSSQASAIDLYSLGHIIISALKLYRNVRVYYFSNQARNTIPRFLAFLLSHTSEDIHVCFCPSFVISKNFMLFELLALCIFSVSLDTSEKEITDLNKASLCFVVYCTHCTYFPFLKRR